MSYMILKKNGVRALRKLQTQSDTIQEITIIGVDVQLIEWSMS